MRYHVTDTTNGRTAEVEGAMSPAEAAHAGYTALQGGSRDAVNGDWEVRAPTIAEDWNVEVANLDSELRSHRDHFYVYPRRNIPVTETPKLLTSGATKVTVHDEPVPASASGGIKAMIESAVKKAVAEAAFTG